MQIRLYIDEDAMASALVQGLRARGVDVYSVGEQIRRLIELIGTKSSGEMKDRLTFL
jgi:hypothetical protein